MTSTAEKPAAEKPPESPLELLPRLSLSEMETGLGRAGVLRSSIPRSASASLAGDSSPFPKSRTVREVIDKSADEVMSDLLRVSSSAHQSRSSSYAGVMLMDELLGPGVQVLGFRFPESKGLDRSATTGLKILHRPANPRPKKLNRPTAFVCACQSRCAADELAAGPTFTLGPIFSAGHFICIDITRSLALATGVALTDGIRLCAKLGLSALKARPELSGARSSSDQILYKGKLVCWEPSQRISKN
ncbi:uncharacterized protein BJ171DRAFT_565885 [Polychytrium aggregatum]|uniref:uncharacterized protein n=1 Tax=Polychytrium aggregatum TaxID=110093 RepID=UPI0022FE0407|nr:uncharacterized protein BJ171DRAFT_565885 [Polychytrium aggregatum]KAI9207588.1 hypothetical protein BJ171DRAFT_565885 [Polychytrium aggregatum]